MPPTPTAVIRRRPVLVAALAIGALVVVAHAPYLLGASDPNPLGPRSGLVVEARRGVLLGQPTIDPNNGFTSQALGNLAARTWLRGEVPWWNHFEGLGSPLAGETQNAPFFPLTLLVAVPWGQLVEHMLLEWLAGLATYLVLRRLRVRNLVALACGAAFALNGTFAWFQHAPVNPIAFLPLLVLGIERAADAADAGRRGGWLLVALALGLSLVAGFPETAYIDGLLATAWAIWRVGGIRAAGRRRYLAKLAGGGVVGLLVAAPALVALVGYLPEAFAAGHGGAGFSHAHLPAAGASAVVLPYVYGPIFAFNGYAHGSRFLDVFWGNTGGFVGASLVPLALAGLVARRHGSLRLVLGAWVAVALAATFGVGPAAWIVYHLPGMRAVAFYRYGPPSWEFAVVVLAALGVEELLSPRRSRVAIAIACAGGLVLVSVALRAAWPEVRALTGAPRHLRFAVGSFGWAAVVVVIVTGALAARRRMSVAIVCAAIVVDAIAMFGLPELSAPRHVRIDTAPVRFLSAHLGTARFATLGPIAPDYGSYWRIAELNTNDVPIPKRWRRYVRDRLDPDVDPVIFVGSAAGRPAGAPAPAAELVSHLDGYRDAAVRYIVTPPGLTFPAVDALHRVFTSRVAWIYELDGARPYFDVDPDVCHVETVSRDRASVSCRSPAALVRRELHMPGWRATVGGRAARINLVAGGVQEVRVPEGSSTVRFGYVPPYGREALLAAPIGAAALAGGALGAVRRRRTILARSKGRPIRSGR